jgi:hypothetical protein
MGLATGLVFVHPLSAFLGTTTVTWDAANCPAGLYTITALARAMSDTQHYSVTTSNVSLPKAHGRAAVLKSAVGIVSGYGNRDSRQRPGIPFGDRDCYRQRHGRRR